MGFDSTWMLNIDTDIKQTPHIRNNNYILHIYHVDKNYVGVIDSSPLYPTSPHFAPAIWHEYLRASSNVLFNNKLWMKAALKVSPAPIVSFTAVGGYDELVNT